MVFRGLRFVGIVIFKYLLILFFLTFAWHNAISQVNIDSLKLLIPTQSGKEKIETIQELTFELQYINLYEYLEYSQDGLELALAMSDSASVTTFLIDIGYYYTYKGNYERALKEFNRARFIAKKNNYKKLLAFVYTALGSVFLDLTAYDSSLQNHTKSLNLKKEFGDKKDIGFSLNNIGLVYYRVDDQERARSYFEQALDNKLESGDTVSAIATYINFGLSYSESGLKDTTKQSKSNFKKSIENFHKAKELAKKYNSHYRIGYSYNGLARVFLYMEEYDSAEYYLQYSLQESTKNKYKLLESSDYNIFAHISFHKKDYNEAINYLKKSQEILNVFDDKNRKKNNYKLFAEIYEDMGLMDSAFHYQKEFIAFKDSIFHDELAQNIANVQITSIIADKDETISKSKFFSLFLLAILALSVALIIVIFRSYAQTSKINRQLQASQKKIEAQKENLQKKNTQLHDAQTTIKNQNEVLTNINVDLDKKVKERTAELNKSNLELEKAVKDLDQFIYKTSHDLRGPIATMQGIINLGVLDAIDDKSREYFNTLHKVSTNLNNVLFRLIEVHETYQKKPVFELLDPRKEIMETTERVSKFNIDKDIKIVTNLEANNQWKSDKVLFNLIIENMLRNAFLYKDRGDSIVTIKSDYKNDHLNIVIEDNGFGIQQGDEDKVFNIFFKGSPRPGGTGLEVYTSKVAAEKLGGTISLKKPMKNTIFEISLPSL